MRAGFWIGSAAVALSLVGCGGGGGGTSAPAILTVTTYRGQVHDQRFGDYRVDVDINEQTQYPGRVAPQLFFTQIDLNSGTLFNETQVDTVSPDGSFAGTLVSLTDNSFSANMGVWAHNSPVGPANTALCHLSVQGKIAPNLKPGSTVTVTYTSTDCQFASQGTFVAQYKDVFVHSAN